MLNKIIPSIIFISAVAGGFVSDPVSAGSRYGTPPPAILSPNLTAPWVLQLRPNNVRQPQFRTNRVRKSQIKQNRTGIFNQSIFQFPPQRKTYQSNTPVFRATNRRLGLPGYTPPKPRQVSLRHERQPVKQKQHSKREMDPKFEPQRVSYATNNKPGTIVIDTNDKFLYLVLGDGQARRYGVGVGKTGFEWSGTNKISRKAEWPDWRPPAQMIAREKKKGRVLPAFVEGGTHNPLGARALYLGDTLYRIHGTNSPWTIGQAVSSGCIRMRNEDVMDLYERVTIGTKVVVG